MIRDNIHKHYPNCHYNKKGKVKQTFNTIGEAYRVIKKYKLKNKIPYLCKYCNFYHIGQEKINIKNK